MQKPQIGADVLDIDFHSILTNNHKPLPEPDFDPTDCWEVVGPVGNTLNMCSSRGAAIHWARSKYANWEVWHIVGQQRHLVAKGGTVATATIRSNILIKAVERAHNGTPN